MHEIPNDIVAQYADIVSNSFNFFEMPMEQKAFAIEYTLNGYDHRKAAKTVGLSPNRGVHLKRIPIVVDFILRLQERNVTESIVSKQSLDGFLDRIEEAAMGDVKIPIVLANGAMVKQKKFQGSLAMDVYRERAKLHDIVKEEESSGIIQIEVIPSTRDSEGNDL
jgi:hypothetical protein